MTKAQLHILGEIEAERRRQDAKFGDYAHNTMPTWLAILGEEFGEVCDALMHYDERSLRAELVQVAAVAVAALEDLDMNGPTLTTPVPALPDLNGPQRSAFMQGSGDAAHDRRLWLLATLGADFGAVASATLECGPSRNGGHGTKTLTDLRDGLRHVVSSAMAWLKFDPSTAGFERLAGGDSAGHPAER